MIDMLRKSSAHVFISSLASPEVEKEDAHHLLKVLRITENDIVTVSDGRGSWITAKLDKHGELHPLSEIFTTEPRKNMLSVAFAPVKGEKPEIIVQKLTELGIDEIIPLAPTRRSVVKWTTHVQQRTKSAYAKLRVRLPCKVAGHGFHLFTRLRHWPTCWPCRGAQLQNLAAVKSHAITTSWSLAQRADSHLKNSPLMCQPFRWGNPSCEQRLLQ